MEALLDIKSQLLALGYRENDINIAILLTSRHNAPDINVIIDKLEGWDWSNFGLSENELNEILLSKYTDQDITNFLIYGYMRMHDNDKAMLSDLITIIEKIYISFYGLYTIKGWMVMTREKAQSLKVRDKIDHKDQVGKFIYATVIEKQGTNLKIHYDGWCRKWDTWSDFSKELHRFAEAGSISKRPANRFSALKKGDNIDVYPTHKHPGWKCDKISTSCS